ncbi:uncharacterized protein LOC110105455 isoform X4 [Dendrobium catenatum]|uniref:uncharacterized protein LOC110105455 isoform X4 n=1 Tax=Dendrobium catenatum TaxID=906689 RepID=UPI0010A01F38|nr:uncharacterized protein LOC110105455 isoform X4 [Dendrobium catenatum]
MFLLRNANAVAPYLPTILENDLMKDAKAATTLEGLIAEDPFPSEDLDEDSDASGGAAGSASQDYIQFGNHSDVAEDEGWITIPKGKIPNDWLEASDILELRHLDRSFVFFGEQLHILVCLSATEQNEQIVTPFKVAAVMSRNDSSSPNRMHHNGISEKMDSEQEITVTKSLLQKEGHQQQIETLLERFRRSNFFVRLAESDEPLWSKRYLAESSSTKLEMAGGISHSNYGASKQGYHNLLSTVIDQGSFDCNASGGVARDTIRCYSLSSGDIVVLLQVNVAASNMKDPMLEVLQFEKYETIAHFEKSSDLHTSNHYNPCGELLDWLLPLDITLPPPTPLSPPSPLVQAASLGTQRSASSSHAGSPIFSFGHFRSYSMPSLPQNQDMGNEELLSFRGISLVPERFSVHCGLEGIYLPGKRWRRKLEIVQPLEIQSFSAACSTEDVLCIQIKNVSPSHLPDIIIFLDSITIIYEDASKGGPPLCLPIASIEAGNGHTLPNLPLRRGEEHSFILKPATKLVGNLKGHSNAHAMVSHGKVGATALSLASNTSEVRSISPSIDQYAILVSCRCNYTESKLFFKQQTNWRPHIAKDLMISVVSEMSKDPTGLSTIFPQLPFQVLTLHATNLTSEDLTLTVLAPLSSSSSPSVVPLSSTPRTPVNGFNGVPELMGRVAGDKSASSMQRPSFMSAVTETQKVHDFSDKRLISLAERVSATSEFISSTNLGCTHLWLQSTVPLGLVSAHSSATVKLELLPLTDGIITLDTLQVAAQEKGVTYTPEQPLKIYATSSISTGIM